MRIVAVEALQGDEQVSVYDLTVASTHLYSVAGVLVSNSKRVSLLDVNALLSHGAIPTLRDANLFRGQKDDRRWLQFMEGFTPPDPKIPLVYEKYINMLRASGINPVRQGHQVQVMALTNKDVSQLAGPRVLTSGDTVRFDKDLKPIPGGLFDPQLTGGHGGRLWSAIKLPEPMPSPIMEEPLRRILGLTRKEYEGVISGEHALPNYGTGAEGLRKALEHLDLDREIADAKSRWQHGRGQKRDDALRRWHYLQDAQKLDLHPRDWLLDQAPVLPPIFRPVSLMGNSNIPLVSDPNWLYKELMTATKNYEDMRTQVGSANAGPERLAVYHAFKAVTGLGDPVHPKLQSKGVKGLLKTILGSSPKFGMVQRKLISSTVDNVGRAVVAPDPDLDMDSIGLPENQSFDMYSKFVVRRLKRQGLPLREALRHVKDRTELARQTLLKEMEERPVFINRAPVLHRWGILAFKPRLVKGDVLKVSPLIVSGFNMDFDGDAAQMHVPTTEDAVRDAYERMLPSKNLLAASDFKTPMHMPRQEYLAGLYQATAGKSARQPRTFRNRRDVLEAYAHQEIRANDQVHILED